MSVNSKESDFEEKGFEEIFVSSILNGDVFVLSETLWYFTEMNIHLTIT